MWPASLHSQRVSTEWHLVLRILPTTRDSSIISSCSWSNSKLRIWNVTEALSRSCLTKFRSSATGLKNIVPVMIPNWPISDVTSKTPPKTSRHNWHNWNKNIRRCLWISKIPVSSIALMKYNKSANLYCSLSTRPTKLMNTKTNWNCSEHLLDHSMNSTLSLSWSRSYGQEGKIGNKLYKP